MKSSNILHSRSVTRAEYALLRRSYRAARRLLSKDDTAFARCTQINSEVRRRTNSWYTGCDERPFSRTLVYYAGGDLIRLNGRTFLRFYASRTLTNFLAR